MRILVRWQFLVTFLSETVRIADLSIAGVTYRDKFDFEERYSNKHTCDPLYWHPLHMPDHCYEMYEKLIRSRLNNKRRTAVDESELEKYRRLFNIQENSEDISSGEDSSYSSERSTRSKKPNYSGEASSRLNKNYGNLPDSDLEVQLKTILMNLKDPSGVLKHLQDILPNLDAQISADFLETSFITTPRPLLPPYLEMLNMVKEDVMKRPAAPIIGFLPNVGLSAIYRQPIATETEEMIKKVAGAYASASQKSYYPYMYPMRPPMTYDYIRPQKKKDKKTTTAAPDAEMASDVPEETIFETKDDLRNKLQLKNVNRPSNSTKTVRKKICAGDITAYIEKKIVNG